MNVKIIIKMTALESKILEYDTDVIKIQNPGQQVQRCGVLLCMKNNLLYGENNIYHCKS